MVPRGIHLIVFEAGVLEWDVAPVASPLVPRLALSPPPEPWEDDAEPELEAIAEPEPELEFLAETPAPARRKRRGFLSGHRMAA